MKKYSFLLGTFLTLILISCSQVDDDEIPQVAPNNKLYSMSFKVSEFQIESTPLNNKTKAGSKLKGQYLQYVIYNEDGSYLLDKVISRADFEEADDTDSGIGFEIKLPIGKYQIAMLTGPMSVWGYPIIDMENFNTDFTGGNRWVSYDSGNQDIYYETSSFEVSENVDENELSLILKPMWSTITINVTNPDVCDFPTNTAIISYSISPYANGFYLKSKEPEYYSFSTGFSTVAGRGGCMISLQDFQSGENMRFITDKTENATIKIQFYSAITESSNGILLREQTIYTGNIERGKHIVLKGDLPEDYTPENGSSIIFNYTEMENIEIPFN